MKKTLTLLVIAVMVFIIPFTAFGESTGEDLKTEIRLSLGNATLCPGDAFTFYRGQDGSIELAHKSGLFSAVISYDQMDSETLELLRKYYDDYSSAENFMFSRFTEFGVSFFNSMEELFRSKLLYPEEDQLEESNMKIFAKYIESNLSKSSYSVLYNTIFSDKTTSVENIHINIGIPISSERTVYTISFTCQKGALNNFVIEEMISLINSLKIPGEYKQIRTLNVFNDVYSISLANKGIYPDLNTEGITYDTFVNENAGYSIRYPSTFIKYRINNITNAMNYVSFKINYNHTVSISAEKLQTAFSIDDIVDSLKTSKEGNMKIHKEGTLYISNKVFRYIGYEISSSEGSTYVQDYFIIYNSILYNIKLVSRFIEPPDAIEKALNNILKSLQFTDGNMAYTSETYHIPSIFTSEEDGFTLLYPHDWKIAKNTSADLDYDSFILQPPGNSSNLEVMLVESELAESALLFDGVELCANENPLIIKYLSNGYNAPYIDKTFISLHTSSYKYGDVLYIKRLINYLDDAGRNRMCYSTDIIRGRNIYSLFISSPDYIYSVDDRPFDKITTTAANLISNSFQLVNVPGYKKPQSNETDKKNAIFTRCIIYLREIFGTDVNGYFPHYDIIEHMNTEKSEYYVPVYMELYNTSGYFILLVNTTDDTVTIVNFTPADSV